MLVRELLRIAKDRGLTWDLARQESKQERAQANEALFRVIESLCNLIDAVRQDARERDAARGVVSDAQGQAIRSLEKAVELLNHNVKEQGATQWQATGDLWQGLRRETEARFDSLERKFEVGLDRLVRLIVERDIARRSEQ